MNINNGSQNLKKFMKETFATRSVNFDFQGPIFRLFSHKVVRNCYLIFILHTKFLYGDILELTQAIGHTSISHLYEYKSFEQGNLILWIFIKLKQYVQ